MRGVGQVTWRELEKQLDPCPLCAGPARIVNYEHRYAGHTTTVRCAGCGLTLEWTQSFWCSGASIGGGDIGFITAWNRRANK